MKRIISYVTLAIVFVNIGCRNTTDKSQLVNPIIGDKSFVEKFGYQPDATTDEDVRVQTHLQYAEKLLLDKDVSYLPLERRERRKQILKLLHEYWIAGIFPRNYDYHQERKPCFIDKENRICAVGYLIEQTAGRQIAEAINAKYKYDAVLAMNDRMVDSWVANSGLTKAECAIIQPTYGPQPTYSFNHISSAYGISSSIITGLNLSSNTINSIQISKGTKNKKVAILGLITGTGQTILGITNFPKSTQGIFYGNTTNESQKTLSMINIGLGTSAMILSVWNLITNKKYKEKKVSWNVNSYQTPYNHTGIAFSLKSKL